MQLNVCIGPSRLSFLPLPFPFLPFLPFPFVPFTCPMSSALTCQGSGAARGHHRFSVPASTLPRTHARLENHCQESAVGCWRVFHHNRFLDRLLEVCTCGNSVLCNVFLPRSLAVLPLSSGTWVEDTSQERCCSMSAFALILFLQDLSRFQSKASGNQGYQRKSFAFAHRDGQGMNCFAHRDTHT